MPPATTFRESGNRLLDRIPVAEFDRLAPSLRRITFGLKEVVHRFEEEVADVLFPTTALVSLLAVLREDDPVEVATVGREGMAGLSAALGSGASPFEVICQMGGEGLRLPAHLVRQAMEQSPGLTDLIHRYAAFMLRSSGQTVACNALHTVEARASRWLLTTHDQAAGDAFPLTQEFLAFMLGVRRQTVTVVAGTLQNAGLIDYRRGMLTILDRDRLEDASCECYATIVAAYEQVVA